MQDNISSNNQQVVEVDQEGIDAALSLETITLRLEEELVGQLLGITPSRNLDSLHALIRQALKEFVRNESNKAHAKVAVGGKEWIEWHGGECPVVVGTRVEFVLRNGDIGYSITSSNLCWKHDGAPSDIVAYRLLEEGWIKWEGASEETADYTEEAMTLGRAMGTTATKAGIWIEVAKEVGSTTGEVEARP